MNDLTVTGIVLKAEPIGEYDRRVVLLTKEKGKISVFARGALRPNNRFVASTNPFVFGNFELYAGPNSYSLSKVEVKDYFESFRTNLDLTFYATYFLEIADYYGRENADNIGLMRLLYVALTKLSDESIPNDFVKTVFEMKAIMLEGEFPEISPSADLPESGRKAVTYVYQSKPANSFSFKLSDETFEKLEQQVDIICKNTFEREFNSLAMIQFAKQT